MPSVLSLETFRGALCYVTARSSIRRRYNPTTNHTLSLDPSFLRLSSLLSHPIHTQPQDPAQVHTSGQTIHMPHSLAVPMLLASYNPAQPLVHSDPEGSSMDQHQVTDRCALGLTRPCALTSRMRVYSTVFFSVSLNRWL
jgi:hypothetical protein